MLKAVSVLAVRAVSAAFRCLGWRACRFHPTCSDYSCGAFARFRWLKAVRLSASRLLRCNPLAPGGFDPLPEKEL